MANNICLRCRKNPKRKKYTFCSPKCTAIAAKAAPKVIRIPHDHTMYKSVKKHFRKRWNRPAPIPRVFNIYLITWTKKQRDSFDKYRAKVAKKRRLKNGNERKHFRAETRACTLGEPGQKTLCKLPQCNLCRAIRTGFGNTFDMKRKGGGRGTRLGLGVYSSPHSATAHLYSNVLNGQRAILDTRIVIGKRKMIKADNPSLKKAPRGFDSVLTTKGGAFANREICVYHKNSMRPAYLIMCS